MTKKDKYAALPQRELSESIGRLLTILILLSAYSGALLLREGSANNHYAFILVGSIISMVAAVTYGIEDMVSSATRRTVWSAFWWAIPDFIGFLCMTFVYVFGCYMFFYEGIWALKSIGADGINPVILILKSIFSLWAGYSILKYETEIFNLLREFSKIQRSKRK